MLRKIAADVGSYLFSGIDASIVVGGSPAPGPSVGGGGSGHTFSRKRWRELMEAIRAKELALQEAAEVRPAKEKRALEKAAEAAAIAIAAAVDEARETAEINRRLVSLTNALEAAVGAETLKGVMQQSNKAIKAAQALARQIEDDEEEEEAIVLLLLH